MKCENRRFENLDAPCDNDATHDVFVTGKAEKPEGGHEFRENKVFSVCETHAAAVRGDYTTRKPQFPFRIAPIEK